jgi:glyoxalase-like protein
VTRPLLAVDHVVYAVTDLDRAGARFLEDVGLGSVAGGRHAGWGTANRIVPLGDAYLELITVEDETVASRSPFGASVLRAVSDGDGWLTWAVRDDRLDATAARLGLTIGAGERTRPDGGILRWRNAGVDDPTRSAELPFFIAWERPEAMHPGHMPVEHPSHADGIAWIELRGDPTAFDRWTDGADLPVRFADGPEGLHAVVLRIPDGDRILR